MMDVKTKITLIFSVIDNHSGIGRIELVGKSRKREIVYYRFMAIELIHESCKLNQPQIAKIFNFTDHSTVHYAMKENRIRIEVEPQYKKDWLKIREWLKLLLVIKEVGNER